MQSDPCHRRGKLIIDFMQPSLVKQHRRPGPSASSQNSNCMPPTSLDNFSVRLGPLSHVHDAQLVLREAVGALMQDLALRQVLALKGRSS